MNLSSDAVELPDDFDGKVRLFPLPGLVMFPHAMQPLHLFEPRYVEMLREALATDQMICMATLLEPESSSMTVPPAIAKTVCLGKIISHAELDDDRHNILLVGIRRATVRRELTTGQPFRSAQLDLIDDFYLPGGSHKRPDLKRRLLEAFGQLIPSTAGSQKSLHDLLAGQMGVGPITDIISYTLPFDAATKLELLGMSDVDERAERLIQTIQSGKIQLDSVSVTEQEIDLAETQAPQPQNQTPRPQFPPPFSIN